MQLFLLVLLAGVVGYWLSRSKYRNNIDQTASRVSESSRDAASQVGGWFSGLFGRKKPPADDVVDAEFEAADTPVEAESEPAEVKPAAKSTSRRKQAEEQDSSDE